jgi:hypothetical protein
VILYLFVSNADVIIINPDFAAVPFFAICFLQIALLFHIPTVYCSFALSTFNDPPLLVSSLPPSFFFIILPLPSVSLIFLTQLSSVKTLGALLSFLLSHLYRMSDYLFPKIHYSLSSFSVKDYYYAN